MRHSGKATVRCATGLVPCLVFLPAFFAPPEAIAQSPATAPIVAATQGDHDQSRRIASIFLTGCSATASQSKQCAKVSLHVPDGWPTIQLHLASDILNFADFFRHRTDIVDGRPGLAACCQEGVEGQEQRVLFYAGHGRPDGFDAFLERPVGLGSFSVGDQSVRYLLTVSCRLFAHGPRVGFDFTSPELFNSQQSNTGQGANVFGAWGMNYFEPPDKGFRSPLNPHLRLACGFSSATGNQDDIMSRFWSYYSLAHWTPADAFLAGLYEPTREDGAVVPLCISRGNDYQSSGFVDSTFKEAPLAQNAQSMGASMFIAFPVTGETTPKLAVAQALAERGAKHGPGVHRATKDDAPDLPAALMVGPTPKPPF